MPRRKQNYGKIKCDTSLPVYFWKTHSQVLYTKLTFLGIFCKPNFERAMEILNWMSIQSVRFFRSPFSLQSLFLSFSFKLSLTFSFLLRILRFVSFCAAILSLIPFAWNRTRPFDLKYITTIRKDNYDATLARTTVKQQSMYTIMLGYKTCSFLSVAPTWPCIYIQHIYSQDTECLPVLICKSKVLSMTDLKLKTSSLMLKLIHIFFFVVKHLLVLR